jgi:mRNA interferase RelE/StbE
MVKQKFNPGNTELSTKEFSIAETASFEKKIKKSQYKSLYSKITSYIYPQLKKNPFFGPNIKRLKGELSEFYRYRLGNYRLFYKIEEERVMVFVIDIEHRKDAYR